MDDSDYVEAAEKSAWVKPSPRSPLRGLMPAALILLAFLAFGITHRTVEPEGEAASPAETTLASSRVPYRFRYANLEVGKEYRVDVTASNFMALKDGENPDGALFTFTPTSAAGCFDTVLTIDSEGALTGFSYSVPDDCDAKG